MESWVNNVHKDAFLPPELTGVVEEPEEDVAPANPRWDQAHRESCCTWGSWLGPAVCMRAEASQISWLWGGGPDERVLSPDMNKAWAVFFLSFQNV